MPYKLAIFDFDGTLADSVTWLLEVFNDLAARHRFRKVTPDEIEELRGHSSREIVRRLGIPIWKLPMIARHVRDLSADAAGRVALFPGIETMLQDLDARGVRLAVASSNAEATIRRIMGASVAAAVDDFECGASMFGKARRIKRILARGGIAPSDAIFVGDETRDIEAAQEAGVAAAAVLWGAAKASAFDGVKPRAMFASVAEMAGFLAR